MMDFWDGRYEVGSYPDGFTLQAVRSVRRRVMDVLLGGELRLGTVMATLDSRDGRYEAGGCLGRVYYAGCPTR
jgi:hypothetical protein